MLDSHSTDYLKWQEIKRQNVILDEKQAELLYRQEMD
jgi:hypothetical protein